MLYEQGHQDPPECNHTTVDLLSVNHEVNQIQTAATTRNMMQVVLPVTLIAILLLINVFFYFTQNPCHSHTWYKLKIHVSSLSSQKAHVLANYIEFADHFSIWTTRNGNSKFYSELHEICSIHQPPRQITRN